MKITYEGRRVLVTGGTRGIGAKLVEDFQSLGAEVWYTGRQANENDPYLLPVDLANEESRNTFCDQISGETWDVLINNAGTNKIGPLVDYDVKDYSSILELNLVGAFCVLQAVAKGMVNAGYGRIVNVTSISSFISMPLRSAYCSSKFGLVGLSKVAAVELAKDGVLVNAIGPGVTETELTVDVLGREKMDAIAAQVPIGRLANVDDISKTVMFLASELNTYMVGQNILLDGGYTSV